MKTFFIYVNKYHSPINYFEIALLKCMTDLTNFIRKKKQTNIFILSNKIQFNLCRTSIFENMLVLSERCCSNNVQFSIKPYFGKL
jgi:hypothetical protein